MEDPFLGTFLIYGAFELCTENHDEAISAHYDALENALDDSHRDKIECYKFGINQLEPHAEILQNETSTIVNEKEECKEADDRIKHFLTSGHDLNKIFCGLTTDDDIKKFGYRLPLIKFGSLSEDLKNSEIANSKQKLSQIMANMYNCLIKKVE